ncbi:SDR family NAD(P)-dependent oxidoreductase [Embleya scabrispora]|uniref:SDR family NAD(P)-dependent oxidoreductase n=1 Tax=Embleya scabrispora TaxID=159449 RepID=UPI000363C131|nr:SDR family NAD(P)-dependent oxidoreductase [Embleya scabrispora]MYS80473.1 SDR family NAD(P)-dependent oxidoreductase [Streptomyces sp. SID5474]
MRERVGRVGVVTGAAGGIGYGIAQALAGDGMRVVLADHDTVRLEETAAMLRADGAEVSAVPTDVRDAAAVRALADAALAVFGRVDVVCNNAGVWTLNRQWETELVDWQWVVDVNLWGVVHGVRTFVPLLLAQPDGGHIVNTASMGGLIGGAMTGPYGATKHAIVGLTKGLRAELAGTAVGVSLLCPGKVRSEMLDRVNARPVEVAGDETPGGSGPSPSARGVIDAMRRSQAGAMSAREAGEQVAAAIREDRFWVLPGADAHVPLLQAEFDELIGAFGSMPADGGVPDSAR